MSPYTKQTLYSNSPSTKAAGEGGAYPSGDILAYGHTPNPSGTEQVGQILDILFRRKWVILSCFLVCTVGTALVAWTSEPEYESTSIVMLSLAKTASLPAAQVGITAGDQLFASNDRTLSGELFVIQNSWAIAERVQKRLQENHEAAAAVPGGAVPGAPRGYARFAPASRDVNAIQITAVSPDPKEAALLANLYAEEYVRLTQEASRTYMSASREFLEQQETHRRQDLATVEERYAAYLKQGGSAGLGQAGGTIVSQLAQLEAQRDDAKVEREMRHRSLSAREAELEKISPQLANRIASDVDRRIRVAQEKLVPLVAQREDILLHYAGADASTLARTDLAKVTERIDQLQTEITRLSKEYVGEVAAAGGVSGGEEGLSYVANLKRQIVEDQIALTGLEAKIDVLEQRIRSHESELSRLPEQSIELARLERSKQHAEQMYEFVVQRLQETRISEESEPGYARILRAAFVPRQPVRPEKEKMMILGTFFGLLLGLGAAIARDKLDNRVYKPDQLRNLDLPLLGVIPNMERLIKDDHMGEKYVEQGDRRYATTLVSLTNPMSAVAEAYRHVRTNIQFSRPDAVVQMLLVTGAGVDEGKSTTAANLALTMAQAGRRTVLVDADLRRPRQHELFGMARQPGLVEQLFTTLDPQNLNVHEVADDLFLIPAGGLRLALDEVPGVSHVKLLQQGDDAVVINPSELLGSKRMREILTLLREKFDVIVIDTPPVLATSDAMLLSTQCDATVMVVRAGRTRESEVTQAIGHLMGVGAQLIGLILNSFEIKHAYGEKYKYQHYSKYGPYSKYGYTAYEKSKRGGFLRRLKRGRRAKA